MPKLILPKTPNSGVVELYSYDKASARHVRALACYLYSHVHKQTVKALLRGLLPGLEEERIDNIIYVKLKNLAQMNIEQTKEIFNVKEEE